MAGGTHLTLGERERLAALKAEGLSLRAIAARLGRAASTVSRKLRTWGKTPGRQVRISLLGHPQTEHFRGFRAADPPAIRTFARTFAPRT